MASPIPTPDVRRRGTKHNPAKWDDDKTKSLLEVFDEEIKAGNRPIGVFTKQGWINVVEKFNFRTGLSLNEDQLKNKQDNLKKEFSKWESLIGKQIGLGWDYAKRTLSAPDEWWFEKAKVDPAILRYKDVGPIFLDLLQKIFGGVTATGFHAYIPEESDPLLVAGDHLDEIGDEVEGNQSNEDEHSLPNIDLQSDFDGAADGDITTSKLPTRKRKCPCTRVQKLSQGDKIVSCMESMSQSMRDSVNYMQSRRRVDTNFGLGYIEALDLLRGIPGMETELPIYMKGVRVLEDKIRRLAFGHIIQDGKNVVLAWLSTFPDYC